MSCPCNLQVLNEMKKRRKRPRSGSVIIANHDLTITYRDVISGQRWLEIDSRRSPKLHLIVSSSLVVSDEELS